MNQVIEKNQNEQNFTEADFDKLENSLKNGCFIMVPESEIINFSMLTYVGNILAQYDEKLDVAPYIEAKLEDVEEDFKDYEDCFDDIHEFCRKIYGGYIEGPNIMSTINYNSEWSCYKTIHTYAAKDIQNINLSIKCIVDLNKKLHKKQNSEKENNWNTRMKQIIANSDVNNNSYLTHVEYF